MPNKFVNPDILKICEGSNNSSINGIGYIPCVLIHLELQDCNPSGLVAWIVNENKPLTGFRQLVFLTEN